MLRQATLLLWLSAPALAAPVHQLLQEGAQKFENRDTHGADADGWINLSVTQRKCKSDALAAARQAVKVAQKDQAAAAQLNLGLTLQGAGKLDDAAAAMSEAARLKPDYATAWWSLGLLEHERKH